jgi:hypothetical protein
MAILVNRSKRLLMNSAVYCVWNLKKYVDLRGHRAWGIEHRARSQESESRIQEKNNKKLALFPTGY